MEGAVEWDLLAALSKHNRLDRFFRQGASINSLLLPPNIQTQFAERNRLTTLINSLGLAVIRRIVPTLVAEGIQHVVLKGPLEQQRLHQTFFARLSTDVDLLVPRSQFRAARNVLLREGFVLQDKFSSVWWRYFLGEQHFVDSANSMSMVDLHWQVQQPGCPEPSDLSEILDSSGTRLLGTAEVPTPSSTFATLLACMSLAKACLHKDPVGAYAYDVAVAFLTSESNERQGIVETARRLGLLRTVQFAAEAAAELFDVSFDLTFPKNSRRLTLPAFSSDMMLQPDSVGRSQPPRRHFLWQLSDGEYLPIRLKNFSRESLRSLASDLCRRTGELAGR